MSRRSRWAWLPAARLFPREGGHNDLLVAPEESAARLHEELDAGHADAVPGSGRGKPQAPPRTN